MYRQPGSSIKPLLDYAPGIDLGIISPNDKFVDEPYNYPGGGPELITLTINILEKLI